MDKKIVEYNVIWSDSVEELTIEVKELIDEGWQPFGALLLVDKNLLWQAMVKYEN